MPPCGNTQNTLLGSTPSSLTYSPSKVIFVLGARSKKVGSGLFWEAANVNSTLASSLGSVASPLPLMSVPVVTKLNTLILLASAMALLAVNLMRL